MTARGDAAMRAGLACPIDAHGRPVTTPEGIQIIRVIFDERPQRPGATRLAAWDMQVAEALFDDVDTRLVYDLIVTAAKVALDEIDPPS